MEHVIATSNVCERLFSRAGFILNDRRKAMTKRNLENLLFLLVNDTKWGAHTVEIVSKRNIPVPVMPNEDEELNMEELLEQGDVILGPISEEE
jgi:hypothetical protein